MVIITKRKSQQTNLSAIANREQWEILFSMLNAILSEMQVLSKSKPNDALNDFKAKSVNKILGKIKDLLSDEPTIEFLELLDEETLPKNSDAVFMIVQFKSAMEQFKDKYYTWNGIDWDWRT